MSDHGIISSLRYLFEDFIGEADETVPSLPEGLPDTAAPIVRRGINLLMEYQGSGYAQLYVDRVSRFIGRSGVSTVMLCDIAHLLAMRMSYQDPIRLSQLKLGELGQGRPRSAEVMHFRIDELIGALPAIAGEPALDALALIGWRHKRVSLRFSTKTRFGVGRLKLEAMLRRWRHFSVRYAEERRWVERWLHMISRSLLKQPQAAPALIDTATMISGYGEAYRQGLADWHVIIDGLVKPTFDGVLPLSDLAGAIAEARAAARPDRRQTALKRTIAEIRARALAAPGDQDAT